MKIVSHGNVSGVWYFLELKSFVYGAFKRVYRVDEKKKYVLINDLRFYRFSFSFSF